MNNLMVFHGQNVPRFTRKWEATTMPASADWRIIAYGNGVFVAVAYDSDVAAYSTDGVNWSATTMPASAKWKAIAYGGGKFVAISESSPGAYSTDGINWTAMTMPAGTWRGVAYGGGKFVAANVGSAGAYSFDGINWGSATMPNKNWQAIAYGDGRFVALSSALIGAAPTDILATSTGYTWTTVMEFTDTFRSLLAYGDGKFFSNTLLGLVVFTTDGVDWTETVATTESGTLLGATGVAYGDGVFVSVFKDVSGRSTDGFNWRSMTIPAGDWRAIAYGDGKFVAVASNTDVGAVFKI